MEITLEKISQVIVMHEMEIVSKRHLLCPQKKMENCTEILFSFGSERLQRSGDVSQISPTYFHP